MWTQTKDNPPKQGQLVVAYWRDAAHGLDRYEVCTYDQGVFYGCGLYGAVPTEWCPVPPRLLKGKL